MKNKVCGVGFFGCGQYKSSINGIDTKNYMLWSNVLNRCYSKSVHKYSPKYKDCFVCDEWLNFQNFAEWYEKEYIDGWHLDKDILIKGNKIYSPKTCVFIPQEINKLFIKSNNARGILPIGVSKNNNRFEANVRIDNKKVFLGCFDLPENAFLAYKFAKENYIKEMAEKWKYKILKSVYKAMINYKVEITD